MAIDLLTPTELSPVTVSAPPVAAPPVVIAKRSVVDSDPPWRPGPGCETDCLPAPSSGWVHVVRGAMKLGVLMGALVPIGVLLAATAAVPVLRSAALSLTGRLLLGVLGVRVSVAAADGAGPERAGGGLIVADHVSWLDAVVLPVAFGPMSMVARHEVCGWPVAGWLARLLETVYVDRDRLSRLPAAVAGVADRLRSGRRVAVFPEGTTSCGLFPTHRRRLRPAFFQSAIDAGVPVYPVALVYRRRAADSSGPGAVTAAAAFLGSESVLASLWRITQTPGLVVHVTTSSALSSAGRDRGELAAWSQRLISDRYRP